ncbi:TerB N-terminal domain-containing protein [Desulfosporosinus hippei]|uniref:TerB-C domain-containing protein n=1 Tax=Desulfosporosinus hippei DSM 8344 TaxID=1121419 RepID=A0A1G8D5N2_9FIRM|nr:TerB N-terminal domain-containing protein [Desulfosporosinus hippei]SDH52669.1 TerB-C domain-containing protein [Desulfosporosinus hippei DSM 8344]
MSLFKNILSGISGIFSGSPYRIILSTEDKKFYLNAYKGAGAIPFAQLLNKYPQLGDLSVWLNYEKGRPVIPLGNLAYVKKELSRLISEEQKNKPEIVIPQEIQLLKPGKMPAGFEIRYSWNNLEKAIQPQLRGEYWGEGTYVSENSYWNMPGFTENDDPWLRKNKIQGQEILEFLRAILPQWQRRSLPVQSEIVLEVEPACTIKINRVRIDSVTCEALWRVNPGSIAEIPSLAGYIIAGSSLGEGFNPAGLSLQIPLQSGEFTLRGEEIAVFQREILPKIKKWIKGNLEELSDRHRVTENRGELILSIARGEMNGIGYAEAIPYFVEGNERIKAEDLSRKIQADKKYIRLESGWYPVESLKQLGLGPMGRLIDGTALSNYLRLSAPEILLRGSERFDGPWQRLEFPELNLPANAAPGKIAAEHLKFMIQWGIPGGLTGAFADYEITLLETLTDLLRESPKIRVLLVGKKILFSQMTEQWQAILSAKYEGNKKDPELKCNAAGLYMATPNALENYPGLSRAKWDLLMILEADALLKSSISKLYNNLIACKARLVLGLFSGTGFFRHQQSLEALSTLFGIQDRETVWKYGVRNPYEDRIALPPAYQLRQKPVSGVKTPGGPAEFTLRNDLPGTAQPIPPRTEQKVQVATAEGDLEFSFSIEVSTSNSSTGYYNGESFLQEAKKLVGHVESKARFVPFMSYWPTYSSMSAEQQKWYFYWRGQVRKGLYPDTDLSYIFVHVYELINNVGGLKPQDGYRQLFDLWISYRERYPKLDHYLVDWLMDYAAMFGCDSDPLQIYEQLDTRNADSVYLDIILTRYNKSGIYRFPLELINRLSDYNLFRSKFYNESGQDLVAEYIPKTIEKVNEFLLQQHHLGMLDMFQPSQREKIQHAPFRSAVHCYDAGRQITLETIPYTRHKPLREFLTAVIKHTENKLREAKGYKGRLRGYGLESEIRIWIDDYLASEIEGLEPATKSSLKIELDPSKIDQLIKDSNKVRDMLIIAEIEVQPEDKEVPRPGREKTVAGNIERPLGTPVQLLTDLEPVHQLLEELDDQQLGLLRAFAENLWVLEDSILSGLFPDLLIDSVVDNINELSLQHLGDLLIAVEGSQKIVADDFRDELEYILPRLEEAKPQKPEHSNPAQDLSEEWKRFRLNISAFQYRVLKAFSQEEDLIARIDKIAGESLMMPEILIDSINELALENLGDIIINVESFPPVINEEYRDMLKKITA